jgi:PAS domain S-box-containing protein
VAPEDRAAVLANMQSRKDGDYVITGLRKDGSRFRAELHSKQGRLGERPVRVVAFRDVTERERTQALLRESEQRLRDLAEKAFDFVVTSRDRQILDARGTIEQVVGFAREELLGRRLDEFVVPGVTDANFARIGTFRTVLLAKDGSHVPAAVTAVVSTLDGEPVRVSGIRDLRAAERAEAERRRLEQRLERSERMESLGVLAGGVAHDFNNLLVGVLGNADLLARRLVGADRTIAENVRTAARRAAELTRQMLVYAGKGETGPRVPVALADLFAELDTLLGATLSKGAQVSFEIGEGTTVLADRAALTQVVMNLLTNASDALRDGVGRISVRVARVPALDGRFEEALGAVSVAAGWVLVEVRDDGVGMDEATRGRIFEPFFTTKEQGHGLGLASCLGIVSAHGGAVLVESEPGVGSCFCVALPAHDGAPRAPAPDPELATGGGRVLVIDDEPLVRTLLHQALAMDGWEVTEAGDATAGLGVLADGSFDVVILDLTMPGVDGAEALRRLRAAGHAVPVVLASGYARESLEDLFAPGSFQGFLAKPFVLDELYRVVRVAKGR